MDIYKTIQFQECVAGFELEEHVAVLEKKISECDSYFDVSKNMEHSTH